jgi:hypothetical protein
MGGGGDAQVGRRRGWPRRVRRVEQAQVREDLAHHGRVLHRGDEPQPTATARAGEDIEIEHAAHQSGPSPRARGAGGAGADLAFARMDVRGRAAVADAVRRQRACGARTPRYKTRLTAGRGMMAASFSMNSIGSKSRCEVPSRQTVFSVTRTRPPDDGVEDGVLGVAGLIRAVGMLRPGVAHAGRGANAQRWIHGIEVRMG